MEQYGKFTQEDRYFKEQSFGRKGFRVIKNGTTLPEGERYSFIVVIEEAELTLTAQKGDSLVAETMPVGSYSYGIFSNPSVSSGVVHAYIA